MSKFKFLGLKAWFAQFKPLFFDRIATVLWSTA